MSTTAIASSIDPTPSLRASVLTRRGRWWGRNAKVVLGVLVVGVLTTELVLAGPTILSAVAELESGQQRRTPGAVAWRRIRIGPTGLCRCLEQHPAGRSRVSTDRLPLSEVRGLAGAGRVWSVAQLP